ncbi:TIR domain-containing protein [Muricoccus aerilatus]|uniref:TIR domain-containing protein n=1 Tax=Muricoccus aerilatus TaxID=452982 RepID=UPI000A070743|nr:TIR domain-containing protein [Roseomonas aerilata]
MATRVFCLYVSEDQRLFERMSRSLATLEQAGLTEALGGASVNLTGGLIGEAKEEYERAQIILMLVSADFLAAGHVSQLIHDAMLKHERGSALVIPVIARPSSWQSTAFAKILALPRDASPITSWRSEDEALTNVTEGVRRAILGRLERRHNTEEHRVRIFISYSHKDLSDLEKLRPQLAAVFDGEPDLAQPIIWDYGSILPGELFQEQIRTRLQSADIVLTLVSPEFFRSDWVRAEMSWIRQIPEKKRPRIIPIILRPVNWVDSPIGHYQALPRDGKAISTWHYPDEAWLDVAKGILNATRNVRRGSQSPQKATKQNSEGITRFEIGEVFKTAGTPTINYEPPNEFGQCRAELAIFGKGLVVEGPSGIGKTTMIRRALTELGCQTQAVWIRCAQQTEVTILENKLLEGFVGYLVLDDFHHLPDDKKNRIARLVKAQADDDVPLAKIVIIGINRVGHTLMEGFPELAGRASIIPMRKQSNSLIQSMIESGERAANIVFRLRGEIIEASEGSFFTAQHLCYQIAIKAGVLATEKRERTIEYGPSDVASKVLEQFEFKYKNLLKAFASADASCNPKGAGLALLWILRQEGKGSVLLDEARAEYPELGRAFGELVSSGFCRLFDQYPSLSAMLYFDPRSNFLVVEDPQLEFYLKKISWSDFARHTGHIVKISSEGKLQFHRAPWHKVVLQNFCRRHEGGKWSAHGSNTSLPWWAVACLGGAAAAALTALMNVMPAEWWLWKTTLFVGVFVTVFILIRDPRTRYMRAFWLVLSSTGITNLVPSLGLEAAAPQMLVRFFSEGPGTGFNLIMGLIMMTLLVLDALEWRRVH